MYVFDHIHYFFDFTGKVPVVFSWIGRLAGDLFLFTVIEGYTHTSNKKKYFTRIYLISAFMGLIKYLIQVFPQLQRGDGFYVILTGVILYVFKGNRKLQCTCYGIFVLAWMIGLPLIYIRPLSLTLMFTNYYEWMSVFAVIFMFLYNGEKGKSMKKLFYIFYLSYYINLNIKIYR
ncbi:hypothetical protein DP129_03430 [Clostridium tetani]|uniref:TraX family protein n=1 Tax=Clostridium tetani TaxID=1513 RepID=UPI00100B769D|nr:hypothetical protein DP129_03430 [Clostridium tetani]